MKLFAILSSCLAVILITVSFIEARGFNYHSELGAPVIGDDKSTRSGAKRKDEFGIQKVVAIR